jgi:hypothetical protein
MAKYCGYGWSEPTTDEIDEIERFYQDPEQVLWDYNVFKSVGERKEYWQEWFQELKNTPKEIRLSWKKYLILCFKDVIERYICEPAEIPFGEASRLGQN